MDRISSTSRHRLLAVPPAPPPDPPPAALPGDPALAERVARWVDAGLISPPQADAILDAERRAPSPARNGPLLAEALGYVGGVLVLVAVGTLTGRFWVELGGGGRIAVVAAATAALLGGGGALGPARGAAGARLRAVTWLLAVATTALGLGLVGSDVLHADGATTTVIAAGGGAVLAAVLWWWHRSAAQHIAVFAALTATAAAVTLLSPRSDELAAGLAVWGAGVAWMLLGRGGVVAPRVLAMVLGGLAVVLGAALCATSDAGSVLAVVSAVVLVVAGASQADLVLLAVGSLVTLVVVPVMLGRWFPDALAAPLALLAVGIGLVGAALGTVRRRRGSRHRPGPPPSPRTAVALTVVVVLSVATAVTLLGLRPETAAG